MSGRASSSSSSSTATSDNRSYVPGYSANDRLPKGGVLYSGPDGLRDYRYPTGADPKYVGIGTSSQEHTGELSYLYRPPSGMPFPKAKNGRIGEIGGAVEHFGVFKGI